jgi:biotin synthase
MTRHDLSSLRAVYELPFFDLIQQAREVYRQHWPEHEVQLCTLMSIKTGGCSEDCSYCAQSAHYSTGLEREALAPVERVASPKRTRSSGRCWRPCAPWRSWAWRCA